MKPMLAATVKDITQLQFPLYGSPKLDGIRALVTGGDIISRNLKPIPNRFIRKALPLSRMNNWDGELIVGKPTDKDVFRNTTSGVMSADGEPDFKFYVFDTVSLGDLKYRDRLLGLQANVKSLVCDYVSIVPQVKLSDVFELQQYEDIMLQRGYEGVMVRSMDGLYKHGRSTMREGYLMKMKRFSDSEAVVLKLVEQMQNTNEAKKNALGHTERSSHKAGKVGKATLGALRVVDVNTGVEFDIGTGLDDETRAKYWKFPKLILNKKVKYKYFPSGSKDKPRFPVFLGIRED